MNPSSAMITIGPNILILIKRFTKLVYYKEATIDIAKIYFLRSVVGSRKRVHFCDDAWLLSYPISSVESLVGMRNTLTTLWGDYVGSYHELSEQGEG